MGQKGQLTAADPIPLNEYYRLAEGLHKDRRYLWELYCRISFCTGLRISEVRTIKWSEILDKDELVIWQRKTKKTRKIPLNESVRNRIKYLYQLLGKPELTRPVFYNKKTEKALTADYINRRLKLFRVEYRISIKNLSTHSFRKTFGRFVYDSQQNKTEALVYLNTIFQHTDIDTTRRYIGLIEDEINSVYNAIIG